PGTGLPRAGGNAPPVLLLPPAPCQVWPVLLAALGDLYSDALAKPTGRHTMRQSLDHTEISQARQTDLRDVIMALGGERHRYDKAKYRLADGRVLSLTDTLFYDHTMAQGGAGAIDLVMHVRKCDFSEALVFLT